LRIKKPKQITFLENSIKGFLIIGRVPRARGIKPDFKINNMGMEVVA